MCANPNPGFGIGQMCAGPSKWEWVGFSDLPSSVGLYKDACLLQG